MTNFILELCEVKKLHFNSAELKSPAVCTKTALRLSTVVCYPVGSDLDHGITGVHITLCWTLFSKNY